LPQKFERKNTTRELSSYALIQLTTYLTQIVYNLNNLLTLVVTKLEQNVRGKKFDSYRGRHVYSEEP